MIHAWLFDIFVFKQKTAYEMRISDWSSDVCSSDLSKGLALDRLVQTPRSDGDAGRHGLAGRECAGFEKIDHLIDNEAAMNAKAPPPGERSQDRAGDLPDAPLECLAIADVGSAMRRDCLGRRIARCVRF